jgi:hypothetical protein
MSRQSRTAIEAGANGSTYGMSVDAMPEGFKVANHEQGEAFFCEACAHPADS